MTHYSNDRMDRIAQYYKIVALQNSRRHAVVPFYGVSMDKYHHNIEAAYLAVRKAYGGGEKKKIKIY
jgi:hypothetical protein